MSFASLFYIDPDHTIIRATRADESVVVIEQSNDAAQWAEAIGGTWGSIGDYVAPPPPPILNADIDAERDRRVVAGVVITVAGYGDVALQGRDMDMRNLHGLATAAQLRLAVGAGAYVTTFRDRENVMHNLTQGQVLDLWSQGAAWVSLVFQSAWALKDGQSIPDDYTDDSYWP